MFFVLMTFLLILISFGIRVRGPVLALAISWFFTCAPIGFDLIRYNYFDYNGVQYVFILVCYLLMFVVGAGIAGFGVNKDSSRNYVVGDLVIKKSIVLFERALPVIWVIALLAIGFQLLDFLLFGAVDTSDLASLRDFYQNKTSSPLTLLVNVTSWTCLYCYAYAIYSRDSITRSLYWRYMLPAVGYFLVSLFSAGRQAAFQLMLFAIVLNFVRGPAYTRATPTIKPKKSNRILFVLVISAAMIVYMGIVAVYRNDGAISEDKIIVLSGIFDFQLSDWFDYATEALPRGVKATLVESMVYFSSCISLFSEFILLEKSGSFGSMGAMTFPFAMRQIEWITGISVIGALQDKIALMYSLGAMGNGWTTGISSYILDFGYFGGALFMCIVGYYSQYAWNQMKLYGDFNRVLIASLMIINAIYLPFLLGSAETNLFLAWFFSVSMLTYVRYSR